MSKELIKIPNYRSRNAAIAREARKKKIIDEKLNELDDKVRGLSQEVDKKIEEGLDKQIAEKVQEVVKDLSFVSKKVKQDFLDAFDKCGGVDGLVNWAMGGILPDGKFSLGHRTDFYKLIISLLKSETAKPDSGGQKQAVIVNISGVGKGKELKVELNGEPSNN
jgi:hypothetical protein